MKHGPADNGLQGFGTGNVVAEKRSGVSYADLIEVRMNRRLTGLAEEKQESPKERKENPRPDEIVAIVHFTRLCLIRRQSAERPVRKNTRPSAAPTREHTSSSRLPQGPALECARSRHPLIVSRKREPRRLQDGMPIPAAPSAIRSPLLIWPNFHYNLSYLGIWLTHHSVSSGRMLGGNCI